MKEERKFYSKFRVKKACMDQGIQEAHEHPTASSIDDLEET